MHIHISQSDKLPIYAQIVSQVKFLVASGRLTPGEEFKVVGDERLVVCLEW